MIIIGGNKPVTAGDFSFKGNGVSTSDSLLENGDPVISFPLVIQGTYITIEGVSPNILEEL